MNTHTGEVYGPADTRERRRAMMRGEPVVEVSAEEAAKVLAAREELERTMREAIIPRPVKRKRPAGL